MNIVYHSVDSLPRLAWCAVVKCDSSTIDVYHGPWVEARDNFFYEGAWSGEFIAGDFSTRISIGTGGKITESGLLVSCPDHTLDGIILLRSSNAAWVSNSLPFALACSGERLSTRNIMYFSQLISIKDGLKKYSPTSRMKSGALSYKYYHCNLLIDRNLEVTKIDKRPVQEFSDFSDYKSFLEHQVRSITKNAEDLNRHHKYRMLTTISSGYDSPTAALLAKNVGCEEAVTLTHARGSRRVSDSGAEIAKRLGLRVIEFDRLGYRDRTDFPEIDTVGPCEFAAFEPKLEGRILFTGFGADTFWDRNYNKAGPDIVRGGGGTVLTELRLRLGFTHLPVPFLGVTQLQSICKISRSEEMIPWSLMNRYDRPIPRRLLEEAGIDRHMFGQSNLAAGVWVKEEGLKATMSSVSASDFLEYCRIHWGWGSSIKSAALDTLDFICLMNSYFNRAVSMLFRRMTRLDINLPLMVPQRLRAMTYGLPGQQRLLFHWSYEKLISRYNLACDKCQDSALRSSDFADRTVSPALSGGLNSAKVST